MSFPDGPARSRSCPNTGNFLGDQLQVAAPKGKPPPTAREAREGNIPGTLVPSQTCSSALHGDFWDLGRVWGLFFLQRELGIPGLGMWEGWECPPPAPALSWVIPGRTSAPSGSPGRSLPARCSWPSHPHLEKPQGTAAG